MKTKNHTPSEMPKSPAGPAYPSKVYLNGEILDAADAKISVFDRGFIFGDGVYEVMARIGGRFFYGDGHWTRLASSLEKIGLKYDTAPLQKAVPGLLEASGLEEADCMLYIQVTRGVAPRQHAYPASVRPTVMMYAWEKTLPPIESRHVRVVTQEDFRWSRCDIKMTSLLGNVMANQSASEQLAYETVFVRGGLITEASHCNIFFVKDEVVWTHPAGPYILDGITRQVVLKICEYLEIPVRLNGIPAKSVQEVDEAFLTGTSSQVMAIREIDGHRYFDTEAGPVTRRIQEAFRELKNTRAQ